MRRLAAVLITAGLLSQATMSLAQGQQEQARRLLREGNALYQKGDYQGALEKYLKAKVLHPSHKIEVNIGTALNALGRYTEAAEHYEYFLRQADRRAPSEMVDEVTASLDELRGKLGVLEVRCSVSGASVAVDGTIVATTPTPQPIYLTPGGHQVTVAKPGHRTHQTKLELAAGQRRRLDVPLIAQQSRPPLSVEERTVVTHDAVSARRRRKTILAYSALAVAGACAVGAAVFYGVGRSQAASAHDKYVAATDPVEIERYRDDVDSGKELWIGGHVLVGVGAVALAVAIYGFVARPAKSADIAVGASPRAQLTPLPGGGLLGLSGSF